MATIYDDPEYDTDAISVTSTIVSQDKDTFDVEDIIAETKTDDGSIRYLVKWEGYPMHACTLEPFEHIEGSDLPQLWRQRKVEKGDDFEAYCENNVQLWTNAYVAHEQKKEQKRAKRERKRRKLAGQQRPIGIAYTKPQQAALTSLGDDSDDDVPLLQRRKTAPTERSSAHPHPEHTSSMFVQAAPKPRKQPFSQSANSSETEESEHSINSFDSIDTMMEELRPKSALRRERPHNVRKPNPVNDHTAFSGKAATSASKISTSQKQHSTMPSSEQMKNDAQPESTLDAPAQVSRAPEQATLASDQPTSNPAEVAINKETELASNPTGAQRRSTASIKRTATTGPIKLLNMPTSMTNPMLAVHDRQRPVDDNPYGRRERGSRRTQDNDHDEAVEEHRLHEESSRPDWEAEKVPLTCWEWRNGSCLYRAEQCRFLHRDTAHMAPIDGTIPPKYRKPPVTCAWWMDGGCGKSDDNCLFAHYNTGWLARIGELPLEIDPSKDPTWRSALKARNGHIPPKHKDHPVTCWYWLRGSSGCSKSAATCLFAHWNTGLLASRGDGENQVIDPTVSPVFESGSKVIRKSDLTCYFWKLGNRCKKSSDQCAFAHYDTGTIADPPPGFKMPENWRQAVNSPTDVSAGSIGPDVAQNPLNHASDGMGELVESEAISEGLGALSGYQHVVGEDNRHEHISDGDTSKDPGDATDRADEMDVNVSVSVSTRNGLASPDTLSSPKDVIPALDNAIESACKLDFDKIFAHSPASRNITDEGAFMDQQAFLVFHPDEQAEELGLVSRWLLRHQVNVYTFQDGGSWQSFKTQILGGGSGVILAHPDFEDWWQIPEFGQVLRSKVRVFSVGYQTPREYDPDVTIMAALPRYDCIEIFPHGGLIYLTDQVFSTEPVEAQQIIELFCEKVFDIAVLEPGPDAPVDTWRLVSNGCLVWRLATRPELMESVHKWCQSHELELKDQSGAQALADIYHRLTHYGYVEQDDEKPSIKRPLDYFPIMSTKREYADPEYFELLDRNQEAAQRMQIEEHVGTLIALRRRYRQVFVVHSKPSEVDWHDRFPIIGEIITPQQFIEHLQQPDTEGMRIDWSCGA